MGESLGQFVQGARPCDSSQTPQRDERVTTPRTLAAVDLSAIAAALAGSSRL